MAELRGLRAASFKPAGNAVHWTQAAKEFALECLRLKESVCVGKEVRYLNPAVLFPSVDATHRLSVFGPSVTLPRETSSQTMP